MLSACEAEKVMSSLIASTSLQLLFNKYYLGCRQYWNCQNQKIGGIIYCLCGCHARHVFAVRKQIDNIRSSSSERPVRHTTVHPCLPLMTSFFWVLARVDSSVDANVSDKHTVSIFRAGDGNAGIYRRVYMAPKPRSTSSSPPWKPQISHCGNSIRRFSTATANKQPVLSWFHSNISHHIKPSNYSQCQSQCLFPSANMFWFVQTISAGSSRPTESYWNSCIILYML
jgi:hypothetical protein